MRLADIIRQFGDEYLEERHGRIPVTHQKVLRAIAQCRSAAMGGFLHRCDQCGFQHFQYHSCRNRHCPQCQQRKQQQWLQHLLQRLLPIPYFQVTFTLPHELGPLCLHHQRQLYSMLFAAASKTLLELGQRRWGARLGIIALLHTWGQTLSFHPHLHLIVTSGGWHTKDRRWVESSRSFLFPIKAIRMVFKAKMLQALEATNLIEKLTSDQLAGIRKKRWGIDVQAPRQPTQALLLYLARYTYRVGIDDSRIRSFDPKAKTVTFVYKNYRKKGITDSMTLSASEFLTRFLNHVLPPRFIKIRYFGIFAHACRGLLEASRQKIKQETQGYRAFLYCLQSLLATIIIPDKPPRCPVCKTGWLRVVMELAPNYWSSLKPP